MSTTPMSFSREATHFGFSAVYPRATTGVFHSRRSMATAGVMLFKGPQARRCTHKVVHTQGGLWPPHESCYLRGHRQGNANRRRCTHKAVHTHGGLWPPQESCYFRGHRQGGAHTRRCTQKAVHTQGGLWPPQESCYFRGHRQGGAHTRRCTHKAVNTQGDAHTRRSMATAGVMLFKGPQARRCIHKAAHTQGGAHTRQCTHKAVYGDRRSHIIYGATGKASRTRWRGGGGMEGGRRWGQLGANCPPTGGLAFARGTWDGGCIGRAGGSAGQSAGRTNAR